jgi:hypothetical protein
MSRHAFVSCACACFLLGSLLFAAQTPNTPNTANLGLVGDRFKPLTWDQMNDAQRKLTMDTLTGPRSGLGGPMNVLLRSPEMGDLAMKFGEYSRFGPTSRQSCGSDHRHRDTGPLSSSGTPTKTPPRRPAERRDHYCHCQSQAPDGNAAK